MNVPQTNKEKGFTIIEVVLVLAIAGLIFLMVFIALPALQRSQRDTQRRDDLSRFQSQLTNYATNNRGKLPTQNSLDSFVSGYLKPGDGEFNDPSTGQPYDVNYGTAQPNKEGVINYAVNAECDGESISPNAGNPRKAAMIIKLEGSGYFCTTNQ